AAHGAARGVLPGAGLPPGGGGTMRGRMADGRRRSPAAIIVMIVLALLWTLPTFGMLVTSFRSRTDAASSGWWAALVDPFETGWTLDNYQRVLENTNLGGALVNSVVVAVPATVLPIMFAAFAAYAFAFTRFPLKERRDRVGQLHLEHLHRLHLLDRGDPAVVVHHVRQQAPGIDRRARGHAVERRRSGRQCQRGDVVGLARCLVGTDERGFAAHERRRVQFGGAAHGDHGYFRRASGQRCGFAVHETRVRAGGAADRLGGVVDEDVQWPGGGDLVR